MQFNDAPYNSKYFQNKLNANPEKVKLAIFLKKVELVTI
jgi:hypothetical protein